MKMCISHSTKNKLGGSFSNPFSPQLTNDTNALMNIRSSFVNTRYLKIKGQLSHFFGGVY